MSNQGGTGKRPGSLDSVLARICGDIDSIDLQIFYLVLRRHRIAGTRERVIEWIVSDGACGVEEVEAMANEVKENEEDAP